MIPLNAFENTPKTPWQTKWAWSVIKNRIRKIHIDRFGIHFQDREHNYHFFWKVDKTEVPI